ncbi:MAG: TolC family protein [Deltaproteobacteria bacterium]|nr:TolC family protein [Deltaproteobacteria bacterium]
MRNNCRGVGAVLGILALFGAVRANADATAAPPVLTLSGAAAAALQANPMVREAASGTALADARLQEARSGWFPRLEASAAVMRGNNPVYVFGSLLEQERFTADRFQIDSLNDPAPENNVRAQLSLQVPLFDQFQTYTRIRQAREGQDQAGRQRDLVLQHLRFEVVRSYFGAVLADAKTRVAEDAVKSAEADVRRIRDLFDAGMVVRSDLLATEVQLSEFRQQQIQAQGDVAVSRAGLNAVLGRPVIEVSTLTGTLAERSFDVPDPDRLLELAAAQRPDYASAGSAVRAADAAVSGASGQYLPRLAAFATYGGSGDDLGIDSTDYLFGARLSFDLLDLGRGARRDQARASLAMATAAREQTASRIAVEVIQAYQHVVSARERLKVAAGAAVQAGEALRIVQDRYQTGLTTVTEVLRAQTAVLRARMNELGARYDHYVGYAEVLLASGTFTDVAPFGP